MSKSVTLRKKPTEQDCIDWFNNPSKNPLTGRRIDINGPTYRALAVECAEYDGQKPAWQILANYKENAETALRTALNDANLKINDVTGPKQTYLPFYAITSPSAAHALVILNEVAKQRLTDDDYKQFYLHTYENKTLIDHIIQNDTTMNALIDMLPVTILTELTMLPSIERGNLYPLVHLIKYSRYSATLKLLQKKPVYPEDHYIAASMWAGFRHQPNIFEILVKEYKVDPNSRWSYQGETALLYALSSSGLLTSDMITQFVENGASFYISCTIKDQNGKRNQNFNIFTSQTSQAAFINTVYAYIKDHIRATFNRNVSPQITSEDFYNVMTLAIRNKPNARILTNVDEYVTQAYLYNGIRYKEKELFDKDIDDETRDLVSHPSSWWLREDQLGQLTIKIVGVAKLGTKGTIYDIYVHHKALNRYVGIIGNFLKNVPLDHDVLEKALQRLHDKRQLLMPMFPYQSRLQLFMFDQRLIDEVKMYYPNAANNHIFDVNEKEYMNILLSVQAALKKDRFVPIETTTKVKQAFSKRFPSMMEAREKMYANPSMANEIVQTLREAATNSMTEKKKVRMRTTSSVKDTRSSERRKVSAQKKIAKFVKHRVGKLTQYFEDSTRYMSGLPLVTRKTIYRALNGSIMQGPYSDIKRVNGLLYAKRDNAEDVKTMVEVVARAPTLPIRYNMYRGMTVEPPTIGSSTFYQGLPFSTTFLSMYALGWILGKKKSACCVFELRCHNGTKGLFLSKLPWMDPWTSANANIFNRIAPGNMHNKFHMKVNAQNEFLMFPYKLKVVSKRTRTFKQLFDEQLEKIDTHVEFDAAQRPGVVTSLFENNADLMEKTMDIYTMELEPISLYHVDMTQTQLDFEPQQLFADPSLPVIEKDKGYKSLFFSPEEIPETVIDRIMKAVKKNKLKMTKLIEKGRYVGPKTFDIPK